MPIVGRLIQLLGILALLMGLLWIGQGLGWVRWPSESFMIDQSDWVVKGLILALAGAAAILVARRWRR
jgi:hypothetical protein